MVHILVGVNNVFPLPGWHQKQPQPFCPTNRHYYIKPANLLPSTCIQYTKLCLTATSKYILPDFQTVFAYLDVLATSILKLAL